MIPKTIHYCWFGRGPKPDLAKRCIESWKKFCPNYEIKEWNEDNFDLDMYPYTREAYDNRKFAFVTDVVRLYALYNEGGIYMDTDVEVLKPLDSLLGYKGVSGFEAESRIPTGLMAFEKGHPLVQELLDDYIGLHFVREDGTLDLTTNVTRITNVCNKHGFIPNGQLQTIADFTLLPQDYLCPKDYETKQVHLTDNTLCIHHFDGSWISKSSKLKKKIAVFIGPTLTAWIVKVKSIFR